MSLDNPICLATVLNGVTILLCTLVAVADFDMDEDSNLLGSPGTKWVSVSLTWMVSCSSFGFSFPFVDLVSSVLPVAD